MSAPRVSAQTWERNLNRMHLLVLAKQVRFQADEERATAALVNR